MTTIRGNRNILVGAGSALPDTNASDQIVLGTAAETTYIGGAPATGAKISAAGVELMPGGRLTCGSSEFSSQAATAARITAVDIASQVSATQATAQTLSAKALNAILEANTITSVAVTATSSVTSPVTANASNLGALAVSTINAPSVSATSVNATGACNITATAIAGESVVATTLVGSAISISVNVANYKVDFPATVDVAYDLIGLINANGTGTYYLYGADSYGPIFIPAPIPGAQITFVIVDSSIIQYCGVINSNYSVPYNLSGLTVFVPKPTIWNPSNPSYYTDSPVSSIAFRGADLETNIDYNPNYHGGYVSMFQNVWSLIGAGGLWYEA